MVESLQFERELSDRQLEILSFSARGYKNKDIAAELELSVFTVNKHIEKARQRVSLKNPPSTPKLVGDLVEYKSLDVPVPARLMLSERQMAVSILVRNGLIDKEIAQKLGISKLTVGKHVHESLKKSGSRSRTQLAAIVAHEMRQNRVLGASR